VPSLPQLARPRGVRTDGFALVAAMVALMWVSEIVDLIAGHRLDRYGIQPREADGLAGVVTAPFLHAGFGHLIANTIPFVALGLTIALGGLVRVAAVTALVALVSGVGTWLTAPAGTVVLGASGVVFGYATYLLARGYFDRRLVNVVIAVVVVVAFGGALLGGLLPHRGISWQAHLFGGVGGVLAARVLRRGAPEPAVLTAAHPR
jgi:membrane associated rhomboid family serine protease